MIPTLPTRVLPVFDPGEVQRAIREAADVLRAGGLVAFPTETVYGLGADARQDRAVQKVFEAKGRPGDNPLIVHVANLAQASTFARLVPEVAVRLADAFWPGPLTLVVEGNGSLPPRVTAGLSTIAVRVPDHPIPRALAESLQTGIVGPSANTSGRPSPTTAEHVLQDMNGRVDLILDAGPTAIGIESTVVDVTTGAPTILRLGGLSVERIEAVVGRVNAQPTELESHRSPGTRHRHYAPRATVMLVEEGDATTLRQLVASARADGMRVGTLTHSISPGPNGSDSHITAGSNIADGARLLFASLRELDIAGVDVIIVEKSSSGGIGAAVLDRLARAAAKEA